MGILIFKALNIHENIVAVSNGKFNRKFHYFECFVFIFAVFVGTNDRKREVCLCQQEIGDVENWARSIERDMHTISNALEYAYKGNLFLHFSIHFHIYF